jgi:hypothetical protein
MTGKRIIKPRVRVSPHSSVRQSVSFFQKKNMTMQTYELRVYKLRTKQALDFYKDVIYPRHLKSFPKFGIEAHGFWTAVTDDVQPRLFVLVSYASGEESGEVGRRYMQSTEFADDTKGFDVSDIVGVESTILIPSTSSPLK